MVKKDKKKIKISFETMWFEVRTSFVAELLIAIILFHFACVTKCWYLSLSALYTLILTILRGAVLAGTIRDKNQKRKYYQSVIMGFLTMLFSAGYVCASVVMFYQADMLIGYRKASLVAILSFVQMFIAIHDIAFTWKKKQIQIRTYRFMTVAFAFVSLAIGINGILSAVWKVDIAALQGITGLVAGTVACVHGAMVWWNNLMTREEHRKKYESMGQNRLAIFTWLTSKRAFILIGCKLVLAVLSMTVFMYINVGYGVVMALAGYVANRRMMQEYREQITGFMQVGGMIVAAGIGYVVYACYIMFYMVSPALAVEVAVAIAVYTVIEFVWTMREIMKARRRGDLLGQEILGISLASIMICFVMTATAMMSTSFTGNPSFYIGLLGIMFGGLSALVGLCMILYGERMRSRLK